METISYLSTNTALVTRVDLSLTFYSSHPHGQAEEVEAGRRETGAVPGLPVRGAPPGHGPVPRPLLGRRRFQLPPAALRLQGAAARLQRPHVRLQGAAVWLHRPDVRRRQRVQVCFTQSSLHVLLLLKRSLFVQSPVKLTR